ncbi:terpene synthase family protein [Actinoallomurus rhizosphaericola]|uniref:terpene synthase family protein n=1 Tax=Actinoallomurus rhizosphaericola TaxID=2952536 RepID=UPI002092FA1B|nr:terpene synthase family protein [Actinoallomurus rhizosphaericola]MCO5998309.1 terpene synthase family protein [Actinoallomurus rhizosphaericola]
MAIPLAGRDEREAAAEHGRTCALATECLRDLQECAAAYPDLFPPDPFGPTVFSGVALANAFGSPWADAGRIRIAARTALWAFAADWLVDHVATSPEEIDAFAEGCTAVAEGAAGNVPLERLLASIRAELTASAVWPALAPAWRDALRRYVEASAREWSWKAAAARGERSALPTVEEYLANADNFGSHLVNVSHWIAGETVDTLERLRPLAAAGEEVQRALRLVNDLATYDRDVAWGDLNSLMLAAGREEITRRADELADRCERLIAPLEDDLPREAAYLRRQLGYSIGFYGTADYWGDR